MKGNLTFTWVGLIILVCSFSLPWIGTEQVTLNGFQFHRLQPLLNHIVFFTDAPIMNDLPSAIPWVFYFIPLQVMAAVLIRPWRFELMRGATQITLLLLFVIFWNRFHLLALCKYGIYIALLGALLALGASWRLPRTDSIRQGALPHDLNFLLIGAALLALLLFVSAPLPFKDFPMPGEIKSARADILKITNVVERYMLDHNDVPQADSYQAMLALPDGQYTMAQRYNFELITDPWGTPYLYRYLGQRGHFKVASAGPNRILGDGDDITIFPGIIGG